MFTGPIRLSSEVRLILEKEKCEIQFVSSSNSFKLKHANPRILAVVERLQKGCDPKLLKVDFPESLVVQLIAELDKRGYLRPVIPNMFSGTAVERQVDWLGECAKDPIGAQGLLAEFSPVLVGCGGTGGVVLQHLVGAGVRRYILIDPDVVNITNFNRQFCFTLEDLSIPKVMGCARYIHCRIHDAQVSANQTEVLSFTDIIRSIPDPRNAFIFCCADQPQFDIQIAVIEAARQLAIPCIFGFVGYWEGSYGPLLIDDCAKGRFGDLLVQWRTKAASGLCTHVRGSVGFTNTLIGTLMFGDVFKWLIGIRPASYNAVIENYFRDNTSKVLLNLEEVACEPKTINRKR